VLERNRTERINATEFELLTATAFDIFTREKVDVGVVEVGMGGAEDATNILKSKAVTVIAKIGLDHQAFLGNTVEEIATQKCGIFREGVPVVYNSTNDESVVHVIEKEAQSVGAGPLYAPTMIPRLGGNKYRSFARSISSRRQQKLGIACAFQAFDLINPIPKTGRGPERTQMALTIASTVIPGRTQIINIEPLISTDREIMIDGAHNEQAAEYLQNIVGYELREHQLGPVTWVIASTKGKDLKSILRHLVLTGDSVAAVEFGSVDGMPWVASTPAQDIVTAVEELGLSHVETKAFGRNVNDALRWAAAEGDHPIVATGSLYLVSEVLRLVRESKGTTKAKG
jgi:folylpolyglutamate synthase/dihydrofolate synthase